VRGQIHAQHHSNSRRWHRRRVAAAAAAAAAAATTDAAAAARGTLSIFTLTHAHTQPLLSQAKRHNGHDSM